MGEFSAKSSRKAINDYIRRIVGYDNLHHDAHKDNQVKVAEKEEL